MQSTRILVGAIFLSKDALVLDRLTIDDHDDIDQPDLFCRTGESVSPFRTGVRPEDPAAVQFLKDLTGEGAGHLQFYGNILHGNRTIALHQKDDRTDGIFTLTAEQQGHT